MSLLDIGRVSKKHGGVINIFFEDFHFLKFSVQNIDEKIEEWFCIFTSLDIFYNNNTYTTKISIFSCVATIQMIWVQKSSRRYSDNVKG